MDGLQAPGNDVTEGVLRLWLIAKANGMEIIAVGQLFNGINRGVGPVQPEVPI